jgi:hypothetical protein
MTASCSKSRWKSGLATVALLVAASGCATAPTNTLAPEHQGAPGIERFLLCAPNFAVSLPASLEAGTQPFREEIEAYLLAQGRQVERVNLSDVRLVWKHSLERSKEDGATESAAVIFTKQLAEQFDFQALVLPSFLLHKVTTSASVARWDGVERRMQMVNAPQRSVGRSRDMVADGISRLSGEMTVASVHIMILSPAGERVFEGRGGLDFIGQLDMSAVSDTHRFQIVPRNDLFDERAVLREGIEIAFDPYLVPPTKP